MTYQNTSDALYQLHAVVHHKGDLGFGHYIAECKIRSKWYVLDDEKVSLIDAPDMNSSTAYILFYKREEAK